MQSELTMSSDLAKPLTSSVADYVIAALDPTQQAANRWEVTA